MSEIPPCPLKAELELLVQTGLAELVSAEFLPSGTELPPVTIERCRDPSHGDFACPIAMALARVARKSPREIAARLIQALGQSELVASVELAGPGFVNFTMAAAAFQSVIKTILSDPAGYGRSQRYAGRKVQVEFVSANPTGPLHVGHGRGAAYGSVVATLLQAVGHDVTKEYYVNDAGRQIDILTLSVWLRFLASIGRTVEFPASGYQGDYIRHIAASLQPAIDGELAPPAATALKGEGLNADADLDGLIADGRAILSETVWRAISEHTLNQITMDIRQDLTEFGVNFDVWFSERSLLSSGAMERALAALKQNGHVYESSGATWFRSTNFGDEKDRVLVRENGQSTYFASDIAYHLNKMERGFDRLIDVWGADHHGYVARVRGSMEGLAADPNRLTVLLVQFANLFRSGEKAAMSTRSGEFVTLRELREEVGNDAARFFYVMRKNDQHLDFDLDLAKSRSNDNPVYYIQYAHARISSVMRQIKGQGERVPAGTDGTEHASRLVEPQEIALLKTLSRFPEVVESAALQYEPHQLAFYLREAAHDFHTYYNAHAFLDNTCALRNARVALARATQTVIRNGLTILGVSTPDLM